jgi:hypothetical protein
MCEGAHVHVVAGTDELITKRLRMRPCTGDDAEAALAIFGQSGRRAPARPGDGARGRPCRNAATAGRVDHRTR